MHFDPKTARGSVDCGRCLRPRFQDMGKVLCVTRKTFFKPASDQVKVIWVGRSAGLFVLKL